MKAFMILTLFTLAASPIFTPPVHADDAGVSLSIGQPGFFGQINIGGYPKPQVIYRQPIAIGNVPRNRPPIYLNVPPNHARRWKNHCRDYNACDERVLFVRNKWYNRQYVPRYQQNQQRNQHNDPQQYQNEQGNWNNGNGYGNGNGNGHNNQQNRNYNR